MSANQVFKEAIVVLKALTAAAASARIEVQKLFFGLEGPVTDVQLKLVGDAAAVGPSAENMPSYNAAFANSSCGDLSYSCALTMPVDFVSYSMN